MRDHHRRIILGFVLAAVGILLSAGLSSSPQIGRALAGTPTTIDNNRVDAAVLEALQADLSTDFVVVIGKQPDLSGAFLISDWNERGRFVVETLKSNAAKGQARALTELNRRGLRTRSFFAANEIYVYGGDTPALQALLNLPEVARVRAPVTVHLDPVGFLLRPYGPAAPLAQTQSTIDWGITDTKADQFWSTFQTTGQGIVVAGIDTGVDVTHPALAQAYRCAGGSLNDPTCWLDPSFICPNGTVCDNNGHGTHTMGTMVGSNDPALAYTVGMAPGAKWIACKGCASNQCTDADLLACADWILAPGPEPGDPALRPQVVNNSWGDTGGNDWFLAAVNAWRAAGIFPAFSAGNSYDCGTLGSPGDYQESFGSAAHTSTRSIADFSSKGPGLFGDSPYTKPNLSAPGQYVLSTIPNNGWGFGSGTSMASPHTAGAVALLWSCAPGLTGQIDATFQLLQSSADPAQADSCGAPASGQGTYAFGYGYLNVLAAGDQICDLHQLKGRVADAISGDPIGGALITLTDGINSPVTLETSSGGDYSVLLQPGDYTLMVEAYGYLPQTLNTVDLKTAKSLTVDLDLMPAPLVTVSGVVTDGSGFGWPLSALLTYTSFGHPLQTSTNPISGAYSIELYQQNEYQVTVEALGYLPAADTVVPPADSLVRDYALQVDPDSCTSLGYFRLGGLTQQFDNPTVPPGWSVTDGFGNGQVWTFSDPLQFGNHTGASGGFAWVNSLDYSGPLDTSLVTPAMNFSADPAVELTFYTNYLRSLSSSTASVDLSLDGGVSWSNLWQRTNLDFSGVVGPMSLTPQVAGKSNVRLRFHYTQSEGSGRWQVDDVQISPAPTCIVLPNRIFLPLISIP